MVGGYDFVIVGAGVMGRSIALYLALQYPTAKCALLQQYSLDHQNGSSHSTTRILRTAYSRHFYRDLSILALQKYWKKMEQLLDSEFIMSQPFLKYVHDAEIHKERVQVAKKCQNIREISCQEVKKMFPFAPNIETEKSVFMDQNAGILMAEKYMNKTLEYLRKAQNIDIFEETEVLDINNNQKGVTMRVNSKQGKANQITASKVALTCGRWITQLIPQLSQILQPMRQIVSYWQMTVPQHYTSSNSPCWSEDRQDGNIFCLPDIQNSGLKYAIDSYNSLEEQKLPEKDYLLLQLDKIMKNMEMHYPGGYLKLKKLENCYYTYTKSQDFLIDWIDQHENVLVVSACSGHGFKFSPVIGKIVSDLLHNDSSIDLFMKNRYLMRMQYHTGLHLE